MNNLKLTKKKDLILAAVIIVIAIVMFIIMNQMQSDNGRRKCIWNLFIDKESGNRDKN